MTIPRWLFAGFILITLFTYSEKLWIFAQGEKEESTHVVSAPAPILEQEITIPPDEEDVPSSPKASLRTTPEATDGDVHPHVQKQVIAEKSPFSLTYRPVPIH